LSKDILELLGLTVLTVEAVEKLPVLGKGVRRCDAVKALQLLLNVEADGIYGAVTRGAVKKHQSACGLVSDGVCGFLTWHSLLIGLRDAPQPPDFKQYDARWGSTLYTVTGSKKQTIATSGCGPTAAADIVAQLADAKVTPPDMAALALKWGCRTKNSGTSGGFFGRIASHYGFADYVRTSSIDTAIKYLLKGGLVAVCFGKSKWTSGGHYCVLWRFEDGVFSINDPASASKNRATGTYKEVKQARKAFYCFGTKGL